MRPAIRAALRPALTILLVVCALNCAPKSVKPEFSPALVDAQGRPSLGHMEHRGEMYDVRDWSWFVHDGNENNEAVADFFPAPMIADEGSLTGLLNGTFHAISGRIKLIDIEQQFLISGFEDPEEDQCVEITTID